MAVMIGSARIGENGGITGGRAGDQTGNEVGTQEWYLHRKGWVVIRAKSATVRELIAKCMERACSNSHIGYDQNERYTLYSEAKKYDFDVSKVTKNVETDCSALVRVCLAYAGIKVSDFATSSEVEVIRSTGQFDILRDSAYTEKSSNLRRGDILVTKTKGHTVVVLSNGSNISGGTTSKSGNPYVEPSICVTSKAQARNTNTKAYTSRGEGVKWVQYELVHSTSEIKRIVNEAGGIDGECGSGTVKAIKKYQKSKGLEVDGVCGRQTRNKMKAD